MRGALQEPHGNLAAREMLGRLLARDALPHALLFAGPTGVGKRTVALAVARCLNCLEDAAAGCVCSACGKIARGIHPDVRTIAAEGTFLKIDQIRGLIDLVRLKPYEGNAKVFIVDDADRMNEEAGNAILKTLEEPPPLTYLILTSARFDALLPTIRSRCRTVRFQPLPADELHTVLLGRGVAPEEARRRAMYAGGSVGTALAIDLAEAEARRRRVVDLVMALAGRPPAVELLALAKAESAEKDELDATMEMLKHVARDMALLARGLPAERCVYPDLASELGPLAVRVGPEAPLRLFRAAEVLRDAIRRNAARQIATDVLLLEARDVLGRAAR